MSINYSDFSVLLPVYKNDNALFFKEAIESIFNQILLPKEIVIIEDGPIGDEVKVIIQDYVSKNIVHIKNIALEQNVGLGKTLAIGIVNCTYDIVARMDADDISLPNRFEIQYEFLKNNLDIDICGTLIEEFNSDNYKSLALKKVPENHNEIVAYAKKRNPINHPSVMFRKKAILNAGNYIPIEFYEDYYLWVRCILKGQKLYNIQQPLLKFRVTDNLYKRRGGLKVFRPEVKLYYLFYKIHFYSLFDFLFISILKFFIRVMPNKLRKFFYNMFLRTKL